MMISKIKETYGKLKIQAKLSLILAIAVMIPVLILIFAFSGKLYNMIALDTIRNEQINTAKTAPLIKDILNQIDTSYTQITETDFYDKVFIKKLSTSLSESLESEEANEFKNTIDEIIQQGPISYVKIYINAPKNSTFFEEENPENLFLPVASIQGTYWYGIFRGTGYSSLHCPSFYLGSNEKKNFGDCAYIKTISICSGSDVYSCYLALYYSSDILKKTLDNNLVLNESVSYITNNRDAIVTTTDSNLSGIYYLNYKNIQNNLLSSNSFIEKKVLGENVYVGFYYIRSADWFLVTVLPSEPLVKRTYYIIFLFIFICFVSILLGTMTAFFLSHSFVKRIVRISNQMIQVKSAPPIPLPTPECMDEIGELTDAYNYMTFKINHLMEEQVQAAEELRIAEFKSLQAQMNPHFLYNTMDMINWLSQQGRTDDVTIAVQNLSRYYKLTLSQKEHISTIKKELKHVSIYINLQNMRFNNGIDFVVDIADEWMDYQIPKLTFQPIIENCILHGILEKSNKCGTIVLTGWIEENDLVILISDDGVGMTPRQLSVILAESPNENSDSGSHIAIFNTHRRLQVLYGNSYGLSYQSTLGIGTEVEIRIPAIK